MKHFFESYVLIQQDIITSNEASEKFLSLPRIREFRSELEKYFLSDNGPLFKWHKLAEVIGNHSSDQVYNFECFNVFNNLF